MKIRGTSSKHKVVLFSGRFDPVHVSHIITIMRLAKKYKKVIVPILRYKERKYSTQFAIQVFEEVFSCSEYKNVQFVVNEDHFGKITKERLKKHYRFDVFCSGNNQCLTHIGMIGHETLYVDRNYGYNGSDIPPPK